MYDEGYFHGKGFDAGVNYVEGLKHKKAWENIQIDRIKTIEKYVNKGKLLDIGCGFGELLDKAKTCGWKSHGVELSEYSAKMARKNIGIKVFNGTLDDAKFPSGEFDAITMIEVIEHLEDPLSTLKECRRVLRKGGIIVMQTGNIDGLYARLKGKNWPYFLLGHLTYFSKRTLSMMLKKTGFTIEHIYNGDEISLNAISRMFWYGKDKAKFINYILYAKLCYIFIIRKCGAGGMTIYARK
jgi:2-polyprenyl-3-methyl-5-hydroxy-6-metoxy-1,4-benzoquinol methylase